ncbi:MAG: GNAT family N-acetyltransferase [Thermomicrobiales bacterium]
MPHQLPPDAYPRVAPLFAGFDWHLCAAAVLAGTCPGQVYADDAINPRAAFIFSPEGEFLAGEPGADFADNLRNLIASNPEEHDNLHVVCSEDGWLPHLATIMGGLEPLAEERRYYEFTAPSVAVPVVPEGFAVVPVDATLLARRELRNHAAVAEWGMVNWGGPENFLARGVGMVVIQGDTIASWCLMDCAVGPRCEIGIATDPDYRRRGLAALATAATVAACLARGFTRIGWHCWTRNLGSRHTAERVGFAHAGTYTDRGCLTDPARHAAERALHAARRGDRATALAWRDRVVATPDASGWSHFHAAAVMAALREYDTALAHLREAVARGGADAEVLRGAELFLPLHDSPEWPGLLARS